MRYSYRASSRPGTPERLEARCLLSTLVALVDTGVALDGLYRSYYDLDHAYNAQTNQYASTSGSGVVRDTHGHGAVLTAQTMAGVLAATGQPGADGADVKILPVSYRDPATGSSSYAAIMRGIRYAADAGAAVINVSVGVNWNVSAAGLGTISQAIQYAESRGSIVVAPSGNRGFQDQGKGVNVDSSARWAIYPAFSDDASYNALGVGLSNLLVTAAVDASGNLTPDSNWGPVHVDVGALSNSEGLTSYASGYAAGVAGVVSAFTPGWTPAQRVGLLKRTAEPHSQSVGAWSSTGGNLSAANAIRALGLPADTVKPSGVSAATIDDAPTDAGGFSRSGAWTSYSGLGYQADHSAARGVGTDAPSTAAATWSFEGLEPGTYRVLATWVPANNRAVDAPFTVFAGASSTTYRLDQTDQASAAPPDRYSDGLPWWAIGGTVVVNNGQLVVGLANNASGKGGAYVVADAVRIERVGGPSVIDDAPTDTGGFSKTGAWDSYPGLGYQADHSAARGVGTDAPATAAATWSFDNLLSGTYRVLATWVPANNRAVDAPFTVTAGASSNTYRVDQTDQSSAAPADRYADGLPWWSIGGILVVSNGQVTVRLANNASGNGGAYVIADAVRLEKVAALEVGTGAEAVGGGASPLSGPELGPIVREALTRWESSGLDAASVAKLSAVTFRVADLGGDLLALAGEDTIWVDDDAAGQGWFVDPTPADDSEFSGGPGVPTPRGIDLLTAVMHEFGHILGYGDLDSEADPLALMAGTLGAGVRKARPVQVEPERAGLA